MTPLHLDLQGKRVLVVGAGPVGLRRARTLAAAGADVHGVALTVPDGAPGSWQQRPFRAEDVDGAWLVVTATGSCDDEVAAACAASRTWCVRADDYERSDAWLPAACRSGDVVVSVTAGGDPRRAVAVRDTIALQLDTGELPVRRVRPGAGSVALVGGGPGAPDLVTVRGRRLLAEADVVVADRLAPRLELAAEVIEVSKSPGAPSWDQRDIEALLVARARAGQRVVRLKGGDVHVFARGMEEVRACLDAGVAVEVVPGLSSALAVPALAGVPLTARGVTQSFTVVSAHLAPGDPRSTVDWQALARLGGTVVLLMGVGRLAEVCATLVAHGRAPGTPVAVVQDGSLPSERTVLSTLGHAAVDAAHVSNPAVIVVGEVVATRPPGWAAPPPPR